MHVYGWIYRAASWIVTPAIPFYLRLRLKQGKEDPLRMQERLGKASLPRPSSPLIWIHAASMGESQSVMPLIHRWAKDHPELHILMTTVTTTSAKHVTGKLPETSFHQYAPVDTPLSVSRFLKHWKPQLVCFVDSELWPNTITAIAKRDIPYVLLNGRISETSARRWQRARNYCEELLSAFTHIFAKSKEDATRFINLGAKNPVSFGNIKFSSPPLKSDSRAMGELTSLIGGRTTWLAASTHAGEEEVVATIHQNLKESFTDLLTMIVPRHSRRGTEIRQLLETKQLHVAQRSLGEPITPDTDIYIADTMGELGIFYRIADIVFVGGSLVPHGGQNPFEPAMLDCAILYGSHMDNFCEFCQELERACAAMPVADETKLQEILEKLLRDQDARTELAQTALEVVEHNKDVLDRIYQALHPLLLQAIQSYSKK